MIVCDPGCVLQRDFVGPRKQLPVEFPPLTVVFPSNSDWLRLLACKFSPAPPAPSQPSVSTAEPAAPVQFARSENVAAPPENPDATAGLLSPVQAYGAALLEPAAAPTGADSDHDLQITQDPAPRQTTALTRHVISDIPADFEPMEAELTSSSAATPTAASAHKKTRSSSHSQQKRQRRCSSPEQSSSVTAPASKILALEPEMPVLSDFIPCGHPSCQAAVRTDVQRCSVFSSSPLRSRQAELASANALLPSQAAPPTSLS